MHEKAIYFDMDGTIADLYAVEDWCFHLNNENTMPYEVAQAMCDMAELRGRLIALCDMGYRCGVISWTSMKGNREYNQRVRQAKIEWLRRNNLLDVMPEIHIVKYGTPKHLIPKIKRGILIDDNREVREKWEKHGGAAFDPADGIIKFLEALGIE